jgi:uncharacterized protein with GYD domain
MPRYLFIASYTSEGAKGVLSKGGSARRVAVEKALTDSGGRLESFDFAFGGDDVYAIADLADNTTAAAFALAIGADGRTHVRTVVLISPEEIDAAAQRSVSYTGPGS